MSQCRIFSGDMVIRDATRSDIPAICALIDENADKLLPRETQDIEDLIDSFIVAEEKGKVVGCSCLEIYSKKIAEIRSVAVQEDFRKRGFGSKLVAAAVKRGNDLGIMELLVVTSNPEFFQKLNFTTCLNEKYALFWGGPSTKKKRGAT